MTQTRALAKPRFVKVKELENLRNGYNVYVKVVTAEHSVIDTRDGLKIPKVNCIVADETATAEAFFKGENTHLIQKGNVIAIRNGVVRLVKTHISLEVDIFGRVTLEKDVAINPTDALNISSSEHKFENRRNNNRGAPRNNNRDHQPRREGEERPRRNYGDRNNQSYRRDDNRGERREDHRERREDRQPRERRDDTRGEPRHQRREQNRGQRRDFRREDRGERGNNRYVNNRQNHQNVDRRENAPRRGNYDRDYDRGQGRNYDRNNRTEQNTNYQRNTEYRPRREYTEKREQFRGDRKPLNWSKISEILPGDDSLNLNVKIISLTKVAGRATKYRCVLGDATGVTNAFLPHRIDIQEGDSIVLFNARAEVEKEHIEIQLANNGRIEISRKPVEKINDEFNLSSKAWVPME